MTVLEQRFMERVPGLLRDLTEAIQGLAERMPEKEPAKQDGWEFDEQAFIGRYCPMEGGNDYLGWIEDIHKLLDGEAEPGDAASTGDYADMDADELHKELKRLTAIVLHQAVDRYMEENY